MKTNYVLVAIATLLFPVAAGAQVMSNRCGTELPSQQWEQAFQQHMAEGSANSANKMQLQNYTIPVIVHVIHGGQAVGTYPNLAQAQINSQIQVLNNDFAGTGFNVGNYNATAFAAWAATAGVLPASLEANGRVAIANTGIQFCLATKDPNGNLLTEPGIHRVSYSSMGWTNPASLSAANFMNYINNTIKPGTIWDVTRYLNIWITDEAANVGLLGFATFPPLSTLTGISGPGTSTTDGVWCWSQAFGSQGVYPSGVYSAPYNRGRTATHEIGHWLGLRHIWGDGTCATDYCADTPPAQTSNFGAPNYPYKVNICAGSGNGEMFMNFMDYTDDAAMYMFTTDQVSRVQTAMSNSPYRKFLGTHGLCSISTVAASALFNSPSVGCTGVNLNLTNNSQGSPAPTFTWSCPGATFVPNNLATSPSVQFPAPGVYTIMLTASNGTISVYTKTVNVTSPALDFSASSQTVCLGYTATVSVNGVDSYTWQPGNIVNAAVVFTPTASQSYTCTGVLLNGCRSTSVVEVAVDPCLGIATRQSSSMNVLLYPNPSHDGLNVRVDAPLLSQINVELSDELGRVVRVHNFKMGTNSYVQWFDVADLQKGVYVVRVTGTGTAPVVSKFVKD